MRAIENGCQFPALGGGTSQTRRMTYASDFESGEESEDVIELSHETIPEGLS